MLRGCLFVWEAELAPNRLAFPHHHCLPLHNAVFVASPDESLDFFQIILLQLWDVYGSSVLMCWDGYYLPRLVLVHVCGLS